MLARENWDFILLGVDLQNRSCLEMFKSEWTSTKGFVGVKFDDIEKARTEALAKMPKSVEFEAVVKESSFFESVNFNRIKFSAINKLHCCEQMLEFESNGKIFEDGQKVNVTITEVVE